MKDFVFRGLDTKYEDVLQQVNDYLVHKGYTQELLSLTVYRKDIGDFTIVHSLTGEILLECKKYSIHFKSWEYFRAEVARMTWEAGKYLQKKQELYNKIIYLYEQVLKEQESDEAFTELEEALKIYESLS